MRSSSSPAESLRPSPTPDGVGPRRVGHGDAAVDATVPPRHRGPDSVNAADQPGNALHPPGHRPQRTADGRRQHRRGQPGAGPQAGDRAGELLTDDVLALAAEPRGTAGRRARRRRLKHEDVDWSGLLDAVLPPIASS